jgi:hypothetical protein
MAEEDKEALQVVAVQVKSKFGGLRFYANGGDDTTDGMIRMAEGISYRICEYCSSKAQQQSVGGWIHTACPACYNDRVRRRTSNEEG